MVKYPNRHDLQIPTHVLLGFCSVTFGWDIQDKNYTTPIEFAGEESSYYDFIAKVDLNSYRRIPWEDNVPFFLLNLYHPKTGKPLYCCPRNVLKSAVDDFETLGMKAYCGVEFEFFCFKGKEEEGSFQSWSCLIELNRNNRKFNRKRSCIAQTTHLGHVWLFHLTSS